MDLNASSQRFLIGSFTPHEGARSTTPWREGPLYKRTKGQTSRVPLCLGVLAHNGIFGICGRRTNGAFTPKANKTFSLCYLREFDRRVHLCLLVFLAQALVRVCVRACVSGCLKSFQPLFGNNIHQRLQFSLSLMLFPLSLNQLQFPSSKQSTL